MEVTIGDIIEIKASPKCWNSALCNNKPLDLEYPRVFKVIKTADYESFHNGAVVLEDISTKINYGFDWAYVEAAGVIFLNKKVMSNRLIKEIIKCQKKI